MSAVIEIGTNLQTAIVVVGIACCLAFAIWSITR